MKWLRATWAALLAAACAAPLPAGADEVVTVFAAASLTEPFREIAKMFQRRHGLEVRFNFAGSQQLAAQLEQGAAADVFASADQRWMRFVETHRMIDGAAREFAGNTLVVLIPRKNPAHIESPRDLSRAGIRLVIGAENVPVGAYSRQALRRLAGQAGFPADYERRVLANVVSHEDNVRGVVGKVQLGEADAGICYRSDVSRLIARHVKAIEIPAVANDLAIYPIALLRTSKHPDAARRFVAMVLAPEGQRILARHGFLPPGPRAPPTP